MSTKNPVAKFAHQFNRNKVHTPKQNVKDHRRGILEDSDDDLFLGDEILIVYLDNTTESDCDD